MRLLVAAKAAKEAPKVAKEAFEFSVSPDRAHAPGAEGIQSAINVIAAYGLFAAMAGFLLGGMVWAVGGRIGNDYTSVGGKIGMAVAVGVAFLIGASAAILKFAYGLG